MKNVQIRTQEGLQDFLQNEGLGVTQKANVYEISDDLSIQEIFELGQQFGEKKQRDIWTKPEEFTLPKEYANLLREAIKDYQNEAYIHVDSIIVEPIKGNSGMAEHCENVTVRPTLACHFFNISNRYGQKVAALEAKEKKSKPVKNGK